MSDDARAMEWALRLAISRCAGNNDAITTTLAEIADTHGCTGCVLMRLLDVVACVVEADEITVLQPELAALLDAR
ncbi:hypothetical protein A5621_13050 [Mycobacterium colombiense]|uniref:hypothetical protein n=1 Tax=Mycobacterium colombiense TaxID=339268 RepID=UPI0007FEEF67|nr:hypothetical protein [Mycobacterium colombiense]OBJ38798.1 hypothetical protein A5621_13050 [Mycobacterium colombiense]